MCDPISLGIMAASKAGSSYFQNKAADKVKKARLRAIDSAEADLAGFRDTARKDYSKSFEAAKPESIQEAIAAAKAARTASYQGAVRDPQNIVSDNSSDAAKRAIVMALEKSTAGQMDLAGLRAGAEAYGDASFGRNVTMGRAGQGIGQQAGFAEGRARVADLELDAANSAGDKYAAIAGIVDAIGQVAGAAYGSGMFAKAPAAVTTGSASPSLIPPAAAKNPFSYNSTAAFYT